MTPSQAWDAAASYIEANGWRRRVLGGHGGPACAIGALSEVAPECDGLAILALRGLLPPFFTVAEWNDFHVIDAEHCVAWLRASAAEMREAGL